MPANSNLAIAQEAASPNTRLAGTAMAATSSVSLMAADSIGLGDRGEIGAEPRAQRLDEHRGERQEQEHDEEHDGDADQDTADERPLGGDGLGRAAGDKKRRDGGVGHWPNLCRLQACTRWTNSRMAKEISSIAVPMAAACA